MPSLERRDAIVSAPIGKTLVNLTWPMLFALVAIMSLGLVDSYFISFLGTQKLAAIGFIMPVTQAVTSIALGLGMAISSLNSKLIGAKQTSQASRLITDGLILTLLLSFVVVLALLLVQQKLFSSLGANAQTYELIKNYMYTWIWAAGLIMLTQVCSSTFRSLGDTGTSAQIVIVLTLVNIILDPLLIFGIGPFPELGMQGAALATVIAAFIATALAVYRLGVGEKLIVVAIPASNAFKQNIKDLLDIAIPAVLANTIIPISAAVITAIIAKSGTDAVAGFGVGSRIEAVSLILVYALSSTLPMFIGQNLGAGQPQRVRHAIRLSFQFVAVSQLAIYALLAVCSPYIAQLFSDQESVKSVIRSFLLIVPISYGLSGIVILINVSLNVLGKPRIALYINILRLCMFYIPFALIGTKLHGTTGLFIGLSFGNVCAFVMAYLLLKNVLKEKEIIS